MSTPVPGGDFSSDDFDNPVEEMPMHEGIPSAVRRAAGTPCLAAKHRSDYPLSAICKSCGQPITCADSTADWAHS
jgi:hypothetical protein